MSDILEIVFDSKHSFVLRSDNAYLPSGLRIRTNASPYEPSIVHANHPTRGKRSRQIFSGLLQSHGTVPAQEVALKWVRGAENIAQLDQEASFYEYALKRLQGVVVPHFFGLYKGLVDGVEIGCMVLEFCRGNLRLEDSEFKRQMMLQVCNLHKAKVLHNDLFDLDGHHFVPYGARGVRIIDFSKASLHVCLGSVPILHDEHKWTIPPGCSELFALEKKFGSRI